MTQGENANLLDSLCAYLGLATDYIDSWGNRQLAPEATKRALIDAMGLDAGSDDAVAMTLQALRHSDDTRFLPAVMVVREGETPVRLRVNVSKSFAPTTMAWSLQCEDGQRFGGRFRPADLGVDASQDHGNFALELHMPLPLGYHRLELTQEQLEAPAEGKQGSTGKNPDENPDENPDKGANNSLAAMPLIVAPPNCYQQPAIAAGERLWGPVVQLYALRSTRNWGIGDYSDLRRTLEMLALSGAHFVGVSPLHAMFPHEPQRASPYSPSSRNWLNVLHLDIEYIADFAESETARKLVGSAPFQQRLNTLRALDLVDYRGVGAVKSEVTELLYVHFRSRHLERDTARAKQFRDFQRSGGHNLHMHALFETLQEHFYRGDRSIWGWTVWPHAYRDANGAEVAAFARTHEARIEYFAYLQWQAELQLHAIQVRAESLGMIVGLYRDLAVGVNEGGSETWMRTAMHALSASVGAPPEEFNLTGQQWGLPPPIPRRMQEEAYQSFAETLRANMRNAGALRLDHVMGLMRLYWVPPQMGATAGAYVSYPFDDLLGILALESHRNRCLVVGEDLGTVAEEVRYGMGTHQILSYKPLYFQHAYDGSFLPPNEWAAQALAAVSTHDLPTLRGFWRGYDLELRSQLNLFPTEEMRHSQIVGRSHDRVHLLLALQRAGLLPGNMDVDPQRIQDVDDEFSRAIHSYIARTPSKMLAIQLEDVFGQIEQVNVPSTTEDRHPNWQRKLPVMLEDYAADGRLVATAQAILRERPAPALPVERMRDIPLETAIIPRATYRLQFHKHFRFADAQGLAAYLEELGVSHVYASSYMQARPDSMHGYDIVNHGALNPEVGDEDAFDAFCDSLQAHDLQQVLDIIPNHMGVAGADNAWWRDVLENGPASVYADTFDIDWKSPEPGLSGKLLIPALGDQYGVVLEAGQLTLRFDAVCGEINLHYFDIHFPIDPRDYPNVMGGAALAEVALESEGTDLLDLQALMDAFARLPGREATTPDKVMERSRDKEDYKRRLADLCEHSPAVRQYVVDCVDALNGNSGDAASFDALDRLIQAQPYRLAFWRVAADEINYRRFFDINELAGLRMENQTVFDSVHRTLFQWLGEGKIAGVRVDHPDGLFDPLQYFERLQVRYGEVMRTAAPDTKPRALYVVVEKILAEYERLPERWPVHGGVGYSYANAVNGLFVDSNSRSRFDRLYNGFVGTHMDYDEMLYQAKLLIMSFSLASELNSLANMLYSIAQSDRHTRDFTRNRLRQAVKEVAAGFPVYRSYVNGDGYSEEDRRYIDWAVAAAKRHSAVADANEIDFVRDVMLNAPTQPEGELRELSLRFVGRFQQFSAPVMAKAMEDTVFYRYNRLVSLNDVGGNPKTFGMSVNAYHGACQHRARFRPYAMLGTSTHDSKRAEDTRARIDVLSEMPAAWRLALRRWSKINQRRKTSLNKICVPSRNDEYLLYQVLLGVWPVGPLDQAKLDDVRERVQAYMLKAAREAKEHTSWTNPEPQYEAALKSFVDGLLGSIEPNPFLTDFLPLQQRIVRFGFYNSLNMALLKITGPGVPDIYRGCETWAFNLVDPDNRRPVDHVELRAALHDLQSEFARQTDPQAVQRLVDRMEDGRIKLYLTWRALQLRKREQALFERGRYIGLAARGTAAEHVVAYARTNDHSSVVVICSRLLHRLSKGEEKRLFNGEAWGNTTVELSPLLKSGEYVDLISGRHIEIEQGIRANIALAGLLTVLPMALLVPLADVKTV